MLKPDRTSLLFGRSEVINIKQYIKTIIPVLMIIVFVFFGVYKLAQYAEYTEEYSYELQEIKDGTYAIYHSVSSNVPANNYDVITICYNGQIHMFQGEVIILANHQSINVVFYTPLDNQS